MDLGDICSLVVAVSAVAIAWDIRRRTTQHVLKIVEVSSSYGHSIDHPHPYCQFSLYVRNVGLALPEMGVSLHFVEADGHGLCRIPLRRIDIRTDLMRGFAASLARGQVVLFGWRTFEMNATELGMLGSLRDLRKQRATLSIFCSGYIVKRIRVMSPTQRVRGYLRKAMLSVMQNAKVGPFATDQHSWWARIRLPGFGSLAFKLDSFLEGCRGPTKRG